MKNLVGILGGILLCVAFTLPVIADELKVNVGVESGDKATQVVGADIYATIDNKLYEITISPDKLPFKMNLKTGALRAKGLWLTEKQATK